MRTASRALKIRCITAIAAAFVYVIWPALLLAEAGAPSDFEVQSLAPKDGDTSAPAAPQENNARSKADAQPAPANEERGKEVYAKNVARVKRIKSLFAKLRDQVEAMETPNTQIASLPQELPPEALDIDDDSMAGDGSSVLDEAPAANSRRKNGKGGKSQVVAHANGATYRIQKGDTLEKIAKRLLGSAKKVGALAKANGITASTPLKIGRELVIPGGRQSTGALEDANLGDVAVGESDTKHAAKGTKSAKATTRKPKNPGSEPVLDYSNYEFKMYVIKPGDSLPKIAKAFYEDGGGSDLIRRYNRLGSKNETAVLKPGEKLLIPLPKKKANDDRYEKAKKGVF